MPIGVLRFHANLTCLVKLAVTQLVDTKRKEAGTGEHLQTLIINKQTQNKSDSSCRTQNTN